MSEADVAYRQDQETEFRFKVGIAYSKVILERRG
jgi:hypothetical protein